MQKNKIEFVRLWLFLENISYSIFWHQRDIFIQTGGSRRYICDVYYLEASV